MRSNGLGRLPAWVVRMRSILRFMWPPLFGGQVYSRLENFAARTHGSQAGSLWVRVGAREDVLHALANHLVVIGVGENVELVVLNRLQDDLGRALRRDARLLR